MDFYRDKLSQTKIIHTDMKYVDKENVRWEIKMDA